MTNIWIVEEGGYEWTDIIGIFTSEELAQQYIDKMKAKYPNRFNYNEVGPPWPVKEGEYHFIAKINGYKLDKGQEDLPED